MADSLPAQRVTQEVKAHPLLLTRAECEVILMLRKTQYGGIEVRVEDSTIVFIKEIHHHKVV